MNEKTKKLMLELFSELELLGPADPNSTRRALKHIPLKDGAHIADIGCGTGKQSLQLLQESKAKLTAVDLFEPMLNTLRHKAQQQRLDHRLSTLQADMSDLPFDQNSLDLIWSEAAIYNIGFYEGLCAWKRFLVTGGYLCVSEIAFLVDDIPQECRDFWASEYPAMTQVDALKDTVRRAGYALLDTFTLPKTAWENYYRPLEQRIDTLYPQYKHDPECLTVLQAMRHEIEVYRQFGHCFAYVFFVLQLTEH